MTGFKTAPLMLGCLALLGASFSLSAGAQDDTGFDRLQGGVQINADPGSSMRIRRSINLLKSGTRASDFSATDLRPMQPAVAPLVDSRAFQGEVMDVKKVAPLLHSGATANGAPQEHPVVGAPYVWNQSVLGGYWDGSGTTKELVRADRLYLFGGRFADGTPVPKEPIRDMNAAGHAFRMPQMTDSPAFLWH